MQAEKVSNTEVFFSIKTITYLYLLDEMHVEKCAWVFIENLLQKHKDFCTKMYVDLGHYFSKFCVI